MKKNVQDGANTPARVATLRPNPPSGWRKCAYPACKKSFRPKRRNSKQRFHSAKCRIADWSRQHPRVDFSPHEESSAIPSERLRSERAG